jgi:hypothetical protein
VRMGRSNHGAESRNVGSRHVWSAGVPFAFLLLSWPQSSSSSTHTPMTVGATACCQLVVEMHFPVRYDGGSSPLRTTVQDHEGHRYDDPTTLLRVDFSADETGSPHRARAMIMWRSLCWSTADQEGAVSYYMLASTSRGVIACIGEFA